MKRIQGQSHFAVTRFFISMFLEPSRNPQFLDLYLTISEAFLFTFYISSLVINEEEWIKIQSELLQALEFNTQIVNESIVKLLVPLLLVVNLGIRAVFKKNFIRLLYIPLIIYAENIRQSEANWLLIIIWILISITLIIDILSTMEYNFLSENFYSETNNSSKIFHYFMIIGIIMVSLNNNQLFGQKWVHYLISLIAFIALAIIKSQSVSRNEASKDLFMRFYVLSICYYIRNLIINWLILFPVIYHHLIIIVISQIVYTIVDYKINRVEVNSYKTDHEIIKLCFKLLSYRYGTNYDKNYEIALQEIIDDEVISETDSLQDKFQDISELQKLGEKLEELLNLQKQDTPELFLIKSQIKFHMFKEPISTRRLIEQANKCVDQEISFLNIPSRLFKKVLIFKFQRQFQAYIDEKYSANINYYFEQFLQNEVLRNKLVKSTKDYSAMWKMISSNQSDKRQILFTELLNKIEKVIKNRKILKEEFQKVQIKCNEVVINYIEYLYMVERNVDEANKISRMYWIFPEIHYYLKTEEKFYISVGLNSDNFMNIQGISYNVKKLLGFQRSVLRSEKINAFLPQFYRNFHENIIENQMLSTSKDQLYHFCKKVIVRHSLNHCLPGVLNFKIVYNPLNGGIFMQGFISIQPENYYNWHNYVFISSQTGNIIQMGSVLTGQTIINSKKQIHYTQFFQDDRKKNKNQNYQQNKLQKPSKPIIFYDYEQLIKDNKNSYDTYKLKKYHYDGEIQYQYDLILEMKIDQNQMAYLYVAKSTEDQSFDIDCLEEQLIDNQEHKLMAKKTYPKFSTKLQGSETNLYHYFQSSNQLLNSLNSKFFKIVSVLIIILFLLAIGIQTYLIFKVESNLQQQQIIVADFAMIKNHYYAFNEIFMIINMFELSYRFGFNFQRVSRQKMQKMALMLQQTSEYLAKYNNQKFGRQNYKQGESRQRIQDQDKHPKTYVNEATGEIKFYFYYSQLGFLQITLENCQIILRQVLLGMSDIYIENFMATINSQKQKNLILEYILQSIMILSSLIICVAIIKLMKVYKKIELKAVTSLTAVNISQTLYNNTTEYLRRVVGGIEEWQMNYDVQKQKIPEKVIAARRESISRLANLGGYGTNMSSRENSVRGFMQQMNTTNRGGTMQNEDHSIEPVIQNSTEPSPLDKNLLIPLLVLTLILAMNPISYNIYFTLREEVNLASSIGSLSEIFQQQVYFSSAVLSFISGLARQEANSPIFVRSIQKYAALDNQIDSSFVQTKIPHFKVFTQKITQMKYQYLCSYIECKEQFKGQLNIVYESAIQKMNNYMINNQKVSEVTDSTLEFRALIYGQNITMNVTIGVLQAYLQEFYTYEETIYQATKFFNFLELVFILLFLIFVNIFIILCWGRKYKEKIQKIIGLINQDSYEDCDQKQLQALRNTSHKFNNLSFHATKAKRTT